MLFSIQLLIILFLLSACDPVVDYEKSIANSTDSELLLVRNNPLTFDFEDATLERLLLDSAVIAPNARQLLNEGFDVGGDIRAYEDCPGYLEEGDTIFVITEPSTTSQIVLRITQSDFKDKYRKRSKNSCECVLEITQDMLDTE